MLQTVIPRRIIRLRELHRLSALKLAQRARVNPSTLQDLEAGRCCNVKWSTLEAIARALETTVGELVRDDGAVHGCGCGRLADYIVERHEAGERVAAIASRMGLHQDAVQFILNAQYESMRLRRYS